MIGNTSKYTIKSALYNAYIFNELYKYDFIKSKSFNLSQSQADLQNKCMHIVKSSANHIVRDNNLGQSISSITFNGNNLDVHVSYLSLFTRGVILAGKLQNLVHNATLGIGDAMHVTAYASKVSFRFDGIAYLGYRHNGTDSTIDKLNNIVNAIMYIPECIKKVGEAVDYIAQIDENYVHSFEDIYLIILKHGVYSTRNPSLQRAKETLAWIKVNHPERLEDKCNVDVVENGNHTLLTTLTNYYSYSPYEENPSIIEMCRQITNLGAELGFAANPAGQ